MQGYRTLPDRFPSGFYEGKPPQLAFASDVGSPSSPIPYHHFACMFRPLLERQYQEGTGIWAKCALVAAMWVPKDTCVPSLSPSVPNERAGVTAVTVPGKLYTPNARGRW